MRRRYLVSEPRPGPLQECLEFSFLRSAKLFPPGPWGRVDPALGYLIASSELLGQESAHCLGMSSFLQMACTGSGF